MKYEKNTFLESIKSHLKHGEIGDALSKLLDYLLPTDPNFADEVFLLQQRHNRIENDNRRGVLAYSNYQIEINKISSSVLYLLNQVPILRKGS